jgi:2-dehydro-3-deoxyglucarate aldolase
MKNMRAVIEAEHASLGTFLSLGSTMTAEACAVGGFDWLLVDLEHGAGDEKDMAGQVRAAAVHGAPTVVRVESADRIRCGRVLDLGAAGIMFPRLNTADEVRAAVSHLRYPPVGDRGVATYHSAAGFGLRPETLLTANDATVCIVQIETSESLRNVDEIAAVPGVDVLFVGPRDLSSALGVPAQFTSAEYLSALEAVVTAAKAANIRAGILAANVDNANQCLANGFSFVAIASDSTFVAKGAQDSVDQVRKVNGLQAHR